MSLKVNVEEGYPDSEAAGTMMPPKYRIRRFLEWQREVSLRIFIKGTGRVITANYTLGSLEALESLLPKTPEEWRSEILPLATERGFCTSPAHLWLLHMPTGSYFGEVLVRNLGGKWRRPNSLLAVLAFLFSMPDLLYSHWYVVVGRQKIPVFELARRRGTLGATESLVKIYQEVANGVYKRRRRP
jgi:hypothetical protein